MPRVATIAAIALLWPLIGPQAAVAPTHRLADWQASRIVRSHARLQDRPGFRVERVVRLTAQSVRICWSEPGYLPPGRDYGCDVVQLRGREWWLMDDSAGGGWMRWL